jgi:hypothetical protein
VDQNFIRIGEPAQGVAVDGLTGLPPPPPKIADIVAEITNADIPNGIKRSLLAKLDVAQRKVDAGQLEPACGSLGAYLNEVRAQNGKQLESPYAEDLILLATKVRETLGCGAP